MYVFEKDGEIVNVCPHIDIEDLAVCKTEIDMLCEYEIPIKIRCKQCGQIHTFCLRVM